jgi:hypothetical protein
MTRSQSLRPGRVGSREFWTLPLRTNDLPRRRIGTSALSFIATTVALGLLAPGANDASAQAVTYRYAGQPAQYVYPAQTQQPTYYTQPAAQQAQPIYYYPAATQQPAAQQAPAQAVQTYTAAKPATYAMPAQQPAAAAPAAPAQVAAAQPSGDPYGFTNWLNSTRASYGLAPVGYDPNLEAWAAANNGQQNALGMGHHVMGPARRQNSAMGNYATIGAMWMASPAHRAALLDP